MKNIYSGLNIEELDVLLNNPQDIETGCENNCDDCLAEEIKLIKKEKGKTNLKIA